MFHGLRHPLGPISAPSTPIVRLIYVFSRVIRPHLWANPRRRGSVAMATSSVPTPNRRAPTTSASALRSRGKTIIIDGERWRTGGEEWGRWGWRWDRHETELAVFLFLSSLAMRGELNRHPSRFPVIKHDCPPTWISFSQVILNFRQASSFLSSLFVYPHRRLNCQLIFRFSIERQITRDE